MILAANQPYFLPYIGYWQLISAADLFLICDDYQFTRQSWISRNRILCEGHPQYIQLAISEASQNKQIRDLCVSDRNSRKTLNKLDNAYSKAPHFDEGMRLMNEILTYEDHRLPLFLRHSMECVCEYLDISTSFRFTSELHQPASMKREERIYDFCSQLGADRYLNAVGGQALYSYDEFQEHGIRLGFLQNDSGAYHQFENEFVPNLSIIDLIMFCERSDIQKKLREYSVISEEGCRPKQIVGGSEV